MLLYMAVVNLMESNYFSSAWKFIYERNENAKVFFILIARISLISVFLVITLCQSTWLHLYSFEGFPLPFYLPFFYFVQNLPKSEDIFPEVQGMASS